MQNWVYRYRLSEKTSIQKSQVLLNLLVIALSNKCAIALLMDFPKIVINFTEEKEMKFTDSMSSILFDVYFTLGQAWQLTCGFQELSLQLK